MDQRRSQQMDQRTRKLMTMHKALHPRDDVVLYILFQVAMYQEKRELASIDDSVDASRHQLKDYIEKRGGILTTQGSAERK